MTGSSDGKGAEALAMPTARAFVLADGACLRVPALRASIAIAGLLTAACSPSTYGNRCEEQARQWIADDEACQAKLTDAIRNPSGTWNDDALSACREAAFFTSMQACEDPPAQGMAARSGETGTGSTEGNSPVPEGMRP